MKFAIYARKPYAVKNGEFFPCVVSPTGYRTGSTPVKVDAKGSYTDIEIRAKLGILTHEVSSMDVVVETPKTPAKPKSKSKK